MSPSLTLFFIVEPPGYQYFACYLAASIRQHLDPEIALVGYCPAHKIDLLDPAVITALTRLRCELHPIETGGVFDPHYPHGNKLIACLQPRDTEWGGFMDSDILVMAGHDIGRLLNPGHVTCSPAASINWKPDDLWETVYGAFDLDVPVDRITLMRDRRLPMMPRYSSGFVLFPEIGGSDAGPGFAHTWMETAQALEKVEELSEYRRPYLDQISLPVAIRRAGLAWCELEENDHYILGGRLKHKSVAIEEDGITTVHYRNWGLLEMADLHTRAHDSLHSQLGVRRVRELSESQDDAVPKAGALVFDADTPGAPPTLHSDVTVVPFGLQEPGEPRRAAGLFDADARFFPQGHCWRCARTTVTLAPDMHDAAPEERLEGRWLYGGIFSPHFGRFLLEATSRLWAIDRLEDVTGILYLPDHQVNNERRLYRHKLPHLAALGLGDLAVRVPQAPVRVEELAIAEQAFGEGAMVEGRPEYRAWISRRLAEIPMAEEAHDSIYLSRSALGEANGSTLGETAIEALMREAGYAIVHPETLPFAAQVATYKAARRIVAPEGAALHLAAMCVQPGTQVSILTRRPVSNIADYVAQFRRFAGLEPDCIDAVRSFHHPEGRSMRPEEVCLTPDIAQIGLHLAQSGMIPTPQGWDASFQSEIAADLQDRERRMRTTFERHGT